MSNKEINYDYFIIASSNLLICLYLIHRLIRHSDLKLITYFTFFSKNTLFLWFVFISHCYKYSTTSLWAKVAAFMIGVSPPFLKINCLVVVKMVTMVTAFTFAPFLTSIWHMLRLPVEAAKCSAVLPNWNYELWRFIKVPYLVYWFPRIFLINFTTKNALLFLSPNSMPDVEPPCSAN